MCFGARQEAGKEGILQDFVSFSRSLLYFDAILASTSNLEFRFNSFINQMFIGLIFSSFPTVSLQFYFFLMSKLKHLFLRV